MQLVTIRVNSGFRVNSVFSSSVGGCYHTYQLATAAVPTCRLRRRRCGLGLTMTLPVYVAWDGCWNRSRMCGSANGLRRERYMQFWSIRMRQNKLEQRNPEYCAQWIWRNSLPRQAILHSGKMCIRVSSSSWLWVDLHMLPCKRRSFTPSRYFATVVTEHRKSCLRIPVIRGRNRLPTNCLRCSSKYLGIVFGQRFTPIRYCWPPVIISRWESSLFFPNVTLWGPLLLFLTFTIDGATRLISLLAATMGGPTTAAIVIGAMCYFSVFMVPGLLATIWIFGGELLQYPLVLLSWRSRRLHVSATTTSTGAIPHPAVIIDDSAAGSSPSRA